MFRFAFGFLLLLLSPHMVMSADYSGNKLLEILGEDKNSDAVMQFKTEYTLDKALKNPARGIKLTAGHDSAGFITAVTVTAAGYEINDIKYKEFSGELPFYISMKDDGPTLEQKFGVSKSGAAEDIRLKFKKDGITINVYFKSASRKKIAYIKFTQNIGMNGPYRIDGDHEVHPAVAEASSDPLPAIKNAKPPVNANSRNVTALPSPATFNKNSTTSIRKSDDPFYNAIMNVIESGEEEMFKDIKKDAMPQPNFWNYKYTYSTSVSIPGEKYNMLYSFPFQSSQLDFVSVLEETDGSDPAIQAKYTEVEAKLKEYFKTTEGWSYSYTVNQEDPKGIRDFELKNPKLGSIVLDYSINPNGRRVLYLRFLLQYT